MSDRLDGSQVFGNVIGFQGLKPDPAKVSAILNMPNPTNRAELETLLGMIMYLTNFWENLSEITSPKQTLLKIDLEFSWQSEQDEAFHNDKTALKQSPM